MKRLKKDQHYWLFIKKIILLTFHSKEIQKYLLGSLILLILEMGGTLSTPFIFKKIVDTLLSNSYSYLPLFFISYGLIWMLSQMFIQLRLILTSRIEQRIIFSLEHIVLSQIYSISYKHLSAQKPGALTNMIRKAQSDISHIILGGVFHILPIALEAILTITIISRLYYSGYSLLMTGFLISFLLYTLFSITASLQYRESANEIDREVDGVITNWISNYEIVKVFNCKDFALKICKNWLQKREIAENKFTKKYFLIQIGQFFILGAWLAILTYLTGKGVAKGNLTVGDFVLFNGYILQFITPIGIFGHYILEIKKALTDLMGVVALLNTPTDIREIKHPVEFNKEKFDIQLKNVSFNYETREILKNISFSIKSGETTLINGPSGIGKSTILKLILRFYDPTAGNIFIGGSNIKDLSLSSLYQNIGYVSQESYILNDTILNNIKLIKDDCTLSEIEAALDYANLLHFVRKLPQGLHTVVGERGITLSAGEKQRLALARIFLKVPKICILDESTSFLDNKTSFIIENNIEKILKNSTKILIMHHNEFSSKIDQVIDLTTMM